ncbi:MAG: hypothetical protein EOO43_01015 [Flavobacterium sp.]|nr:MAG: hypothetical protein EOO43_01015 [Flavobacterium sp.]
MKEIVFLCGARDFHAMDWYRSAKLSSKDFKISLLTDLIEGEGYKKIVNDEDIVYKLLILDKLLFRKQSRVGHIWRNILKLLVFPIQLYLLKKFHRNHPDAVYHAHSMYYLFLADAAGVKYIGTPQGSDILIKPHNSKLYKYYTIKALKSANFVTVDSQAMKDGIFHLSGVEAKIIQNGIDLASINEFIKKNKEGTKDIILSIRGLSPLYRIKDIISARNSSIFNREKSITLIYPFYEEIYADEVRTILKPNDLDLGRQDRKNMYEILGKTKLMISIPSSDSSPRSVYEAIFCGSAVAINYNAYYEMLPDCMKARIIIINLENEKWFDEAVVKAEEISKEKYIPSEKALLDFDQVKSFLKIEDLVKTLY